MPKQRDSEKELARRANAGDAAAFSEMYRLYRDRVYAFAYRMVRVQAVAEDITQEAFLVLVEHPQRYDAGKGSMLTFLCAVARNQIMYYLRRHGPEFEIEDEQVAILVENRVEAGGDPLSELLNEEMATEVKAAIDALPVLQREVIVLREFQELSYGEIAEVTGVDVGVVKVRLHRARQSLVRQLTPYLIPSGDNCYELQ